MICSWEESLEIPRQPNDRISPGKASLLEKKSVMEIESIGRLEILDPFLERHFEEIRSITVLRMIVLAFSRIVRKYQIMKSPLVCSISIVVVTSTMLIFVRKYPRLFDNFPRHVSDIAMCTLALLDFSVGGKHLVLEGKKIHEIESSVCELSSFSVTS